MEDQDKTVVEKVDTVAEESTTPKQKPLSADAQKWIALHYKLRRWTDVVLVDSSKYKYLGPLILKAFADIGQLHVDAEDHEKVLRIIQR